MYMVSRMRKGTRLAVAAGAAALALPASALADKEIIASTGNRYDASTYTMDQGEKLTFRNIDPIVEHDVTAVMTGDVKGHLFASDTIGQGMQFVEGSQYLTTGSYDFVCSVHESEMKAKLVVTANGTPTPRPGTGGAPPPPPDTTKPVATISGPKSAAVKTLVKKRKIALTVGADEPSDLEISLRIGSKRIAGAKLSIIAAGSQKIEIRLGKTARKALKKGKTLTALVVASDANDNFGNAKIAIKLR